MVKYSELSCKVELQSFFSRIENCDCTQHTAEIVEPLREGVHHACMCRAHSLHIFHQCICHDSVEFHRAHKHTLYNTHMYHRFCQLMKLKFSKMTTDGAKRPKISMASLHLKKGKMWWSLSTGARQKDKDIDQVNWKQNALWMLPMHLQLLEVYNSNRFVHWHLHIVLWVLHRRIYDFCV